MATREFLVPGVFVTKGDTTLFLPEGGGQSDYIEVTDDRLIRR